MTSSAPLDLSVQTVRSADYDYDHDHDRNQPQNQQLQMVSRQLQRDKAARRARRGRRRPRPPDTAPPTCSGPPPAFGDGILRQYEPAVFAELDTGVSVSSDDRNKPATWRMDENSPVTTIPDDSGHVLPFGRRGKTGQIVLPYFSSVCGRNNTKT